MKTKTAPEFETLHIDIVSLSEGDTLPTEFRLFTSGKVDTLKGSFLFDDVAAKDVMSAHTDYGNDLCLDYDHAMQDPFCSPRDRIAAGWFGLEVRDGELWAVNVRWTPAATRQLTDREWRYMSPAFTVSGENRRIARVINCALTNIPATKNLTPIAASQTGESVVSTEGNGIPMKQLLSALGLGADATEADALVTLSKREDATQRLFVLTGKTSVGDALAQTEAWKAQASETVGLRAALASEKKAREDAIALSSIDKAHDEKRITPAQVETAKKLYADHGVAALDVFLSAFVMAQVAVGEKLTPQAKNEDTKALSDVEKRIAISLGIPLEQALANKLSQGGAA
jgi:phage I-like protein